MNKIGFHYYQGSSLAALAIRVRLATVYTHVAIQIGDRCVIQSDIVRGNRLTKVSDLPEPTETHWVDVGPAELDRAHGLARQFAEQDYDYLAMLGFMIGFKWQSDGAAFCSEIGRMVLEDVTGNRVDHPTLLSPDGLRLVTQTYTNWLR